MQQGFSSSPFLALKGPEPLALGLLLGSRDQEDLAHILLLLHLLHGISHLDRKRRPLLVPSVPSHRTNPIFLGSSPESLNLPSPTQTLPGGSTLTFSKGQTESIRGLMRP